LYTYKITDTGIKKSNNKKVAFVWEKITIAKKENTNLIPLVIETPENYCTIVEIADVLRNILGEYQ